MQNATFTQSVQKLPMHDYNKIGEQRDSLGQW